MIIRPVKLRFMARYPDVSNSPTPSHLHGLRHPLQGLSSVPASWAVCHSPAEFERASSSIRSRVELTPSPPWVGWGLYSGPIGLCIQDPGYRLSRMPLLRASVDKSNGAAPRPCRSFHRMRCIAYAQQSRQVPLSKQVYPDAQQLDLVPFVNLVRSVGKGGALQCSSAAPRVLWPLQ
jgi:hypothetical protein